MKKLTLAYFGTPYFSAQFLEKLITDTELNKILDVKFVVTQADKPVGRKQIMTKSPVKVVADKLKIPVFDSLRKLRVMSYELREVDFALVFAYGELIPKELLELPKFGFWNIHPSLLPKYRGSSPIAYPLILGDTKTGVTIIKMDEKIDHGPIIAQREVEIFPTDKRSNLEIRLTDLAFEMFKYVIDVIARTPTFRRRTWQSKRGIAHNDKVRLKPQNHSLTTYVSYLKRTDGFIPFPILEKTLQNKPLIFEELPMLLQRYLIKNYKFQNPNYKSISKSKIQIRKMVSFEYLTINHLNLINNLKFDIKNSSKIIFNYFRGLFPWPGIWTFVNINKQEKRLKITDMDLINGKLIIKKVQLEGKKEIDFKTFNKAYKIF